MSKDLLFIKFQRQQCLNEICSGLIQIHTKDCKNKDIIPLYNYKLRIKIMHKDLLIIKFQRQQCLIEIHSGPKCLLRIVRTKI